MNLEEAKSKYKLEDIEDKLDIRDLMEIMEGLEDTDGFFTRIVIYNSDVAKWLEKEGLARQSARGSYAKAGDLEIVSEAIRRQYYERLDSK